MKDLQPAWFLAPYLVWLGLLDWVAEHTRKSQAQVLAEARVEVRRSGYLHVKRIGVGAALLGLLVLLTAHVAAPVVEIAGLYMPHEAVLPVSALLGTIALLAVFGLILRRAYRTLAMLYVRGFRVWARRQALYEP